MYQVYMSGKLLGTVRVVVCTIELLVRNEKLEDVLCL